MKEGASRETMLSACLDDDNDDITFPSNFYIACYITFRKHVIRLRCLYSFTINDDDDDKTCPSNFHVSVSIAFGKY